MFNLADNNRLTEIRYGLQSPNFARRVEAVKHFAELIPAVLVEENTFLAALYASNDLSTQDQDVLNAAVQEAVAYLSVVTTDPHVTTNPDRMIQVAFFFNVLGKAEHLRESLTSLRIEHSASKDEVNKLKLCVKLLESDLRVEQQKRKEAEAKGESNSYYSAETKGQGMAEDFEELVNDVSESMEKMDNKLRKEQDRREKAEEELSRHKSLNSELTKKICLMEEKIANMENEERMKQMKAAVWNHILETTVSNADLRISELKCKNDDLTCALKASEERVADQGEEIQNLLQRLDDQKRHEEQPEVKVTDKERSNLIMQLNERERENNKLKNNANDLLEKLTSAHNQNRKTYKALYATIVRKNELIAAIGEKLDQESRNAMKPLIMESCKSDTDVLKAAV